MKVKVSVTLDIDPESWDMNYGTGTDASAVREDVREWATQLLYQAADQNGVTRG